MKDRLTMAAEQVRRAMVEYGEARFLSSLYSLYETFTDNEADLSKLNSF